MAVAADDFVARVFAHDAKLAELGSKLAQAYAKAEPYPHAVFDGLFDESVLDEVLAEFPGARDIDWIKFDAYHEVKLASKRESDLGAKTRVLMHWFNSQPFVEFLEKLTGIPGLIPDPHLEGGGLHQIVRGGKLGVHADFNRHLGLKLDRRLNVLVYLNKDWPEDYGGHFELWTRDMKTRVKRVLPVFNRMVVFSTTDFSFHGHPEPLTCPANRTRKSLALYYYSNGRPPEELSGDHSTLFQFRPGERVSWTPRSFVRRLVPPIVRDLRDMLFPRSKAKRS